MGGACGLTVVDAYTREALTIEVDQGIKGEQVFDAIARVASMRGPPKAIRVDNGPEFVSKALDRWAEPAEAHAMRSIVGWEAEGYENAVTLDFSRLGRPTDNAFVQSFNGRVPEHTLILVAGRRQGQDRSLAPGLQREPPSHIAWLEDAERIRFRIRP